MAIADSQVSLWHRGNPLPLLPSGPDGVHGTALHRTRLSAIDIPGLVNSYLLLVSGQQHQTQAVGPGSLLAINY